mmetsp:Transcript_20253/g.49246  ORF Transcript_20253/g.49246 Transcript_20253/m.49246 type:complete len:732 (-) Transcript_20253:41-2236(-)
MQILAWTLLAEGSKSDTPIGKVIKMLEDLTASIETEGREEAASYDKFACFCKSQTKGKSLSITAEATKIDTETANLEEFTSDKKQTESSISSLKAKIEDATNDLDQLKQKWTAYLAKYTAEHTDMEGACEQLTKAIKLLEDSKAAAEKLASSEGGGDDSLAQVKSTVKRALLVAESLNIPQTKATRAFLQDDGDTPESDYDTHSGGIVDTLKKVEKQFLAEKAEMEEEHDKRVNANNEQVSGIQSLMKTQKDSLISAEEKLSGLEQSIADSMKALAESQSLLHDDQTFLKELTGKCEDKAKQWDQRTNARGKELGALAQALSIIKGTVSDKESSAERALLQERADDLTEDDEPDSTVYDGDNDTPDSEDDDPPEADEDADGSNIDEDSFVQVGQHKSFMRALTPTEKAVALLKSKGKTLRSQTLSQLALELRADPFKKIKGLIQSLINRLLKEAAEEATQKGWCDTEMSRENKTATLNRNKVAADSAAIEEAEATKASKEADIETLEGEIADLKSELANATELRADEKKENEDALEDAQSGAKAVQRAITLLKDHYKKAETKARVFNGGNAVNKNRFTGKLLQVKGVSDDAPDAGFGKGYKGDQEGGKGVIGTLEELRDQFNAAAKTTAKDEKAAADAHVEFSKETKSTISSKETSLSHAERDLADTKRELTEQLGNLKKHQELCDNALQALDKLVMKCIDAGMDYDERKRRRDEEIAALHKAIELFDKKS